MHFQLTFENLNNEQKEIVIARLYEQCEGFEETDSSLRAIVNEENFDESLTGLIGSLALTPQIEQIPEQNWNEVWESNFEPVVIDDFVAVRAHFHEPIQSVEHEIVITPKMSFGTGHHATTFLMIKMMRDIKFSGKTVFDFGTGTGILAILARKLGATKVLATDIDYWSIENSVENFERNQTDNIQLIKSDSAAQDGNFDVILANINKNVLMYSVGELSKQMANGATMLLSGLLEADEIDILEQCTNHGLKLIEKIERNGWIALKLRQL